MGGVGLSGAGLTLVNSGTISGGLPGNGSTTNRADAISFTGGTNRLTTNAGGSYSGAISVSAANGGSLVLDQTDAAGGTSGATYSNAITGSGALSVNTTADRIVTLSGANTYLGGTTLAGGIINAGSGGALGVSGAISFTGGTLQYSAANQTDYSNRFSTAANQAYRIDTNGQAVTLASALSSSGGSLTKLGAGTLTLLASNGYTGATTINAGGGLTLIGSGSISQSSGVANDGTFDISAASAGTAIQTLSGTGGTTLGAQSLTITNGSTSYSGVMSGTGGVTVTGGTQTLSGANTYTGGTTVAGGTLTIGAGATSGLIAGDVAVSAGATLGFNRSNAMSYGGLITGAGTVSQIGSGTTTLTGANTSGSQFTGRAAVTAGTLLVNGTFGDTASRASAVTVGDGTNANTGTLGGSGIVAGTVTVQRGGTLSAGNSPGVLSTGNLSLEVGATLAQEITGTTVGTNYDQISVTGTVSLAGATLTLSFGGFTSSAGNRFVIINNDGSDAITGSGGLRSPSLVYGGSTLTEGSTFTANNRTYQISYRGIGGVDGIGNDVTLTDVTALPSDPAPVGPTSGDDNLVGTAGPDTISLGLGNDAFTGGAGNDLVYGNQGNDLIYGNQDADTLYGGQGDDRAFGGQGDDRLFGNLGNDVLYGNSGADIVYGNQGNDIVYGNQGADILFGGQGNDVLYGGQDADTLVGGIGDDTLVGGLGADLYRFDPNSGRDLILGFNQGEGDRIALGGQTYMISSAQNGDALLTLSGGGVVDLAGIRAEQVNASYFAA